MPRTDSLEFAEQQAEASRLVALRARHSPMGHPIPPRPEGAIEHRAANPFLPGMWVYRAMTPEAFLALPFWRQMLSALRYDGRCPYNNFWIKAVMAAKWTSFPLAKRERFVRWYRRTTDEYPYGQFRQQRVMFVNPGDLPHPNTQHAREVSTWLYSWKLSCQNCEQSYLPQVAEEKAMYDATHGQPYNDELNRRHRLMHVYCPECRATNGECHACGGLLQLRHQVPVPSAFAHLCSNCYEGAFGHPIGEYNMNPVRLLAPRMTFDPKTIYEGVELEVETLNGEPEQVASSFRSVLEAKSVIKRDGSLNDGFEICSLPMTLDEHRRYWGNVFKHPQWINVSADECYRAGLHIHASRAPLSKLQIARFVHFFTQPENRAFITGMAGRRENTYCVYQPNGQSLKTTARKLQGVEPVGKYEVVNLCHRDTIEVRAFQSTKDYHKLVGRLEFVISGLHFSNMRQSKELSWKNYLDWLYEAPNRKAFPTAYLLSKLSVPPDETPPQVAGFAEFYEAMNTAERQLYCARLACRCRVCVNNNRRTEEAHHYYPFRATVPPRNVRRRDNHIDGVPQAHFMPITTMIEELHGFGAWHSLGRETRETVARRQTQRPPTFSNTEGSAGMTIDTIATPQARARSVQDL